MYSPSEIESYLQRIISIHQTLGIADSYRKTIKLPLQLEAHTLANAGADVFNRPQQLTPAALKYWREMQAAAHTDGITLSLISAFRSVDYQRGLIARKLAAGQNIERILTVNAAPGYSEHHTGRALDITTKECEPLSESFADTPAFTWLNVNAARYGFALSYPRDNPYGLAYEPWHWTFLETTADQLSADSSADSSPQKS